MTKPLITGDTTLAELRRLLDERGVKSLEVHRHKWHGPHEPSSFSGGARTKSETVSTSSHPTLAEALSALLAEIPEVQR